MEEENAVTLEHANHAMTQLLQWAASPRGGNNLYGRVLNGCGLRPDSKISPPTIQVMLTRIGQYYLSWHPEWFEQQEGPFQYLLMVHEAAHLALCHLEEMVRLFVDIRGTPRFRNVYEIMQVAMDMEVNDCAVRGVIESRKESFQKYNDQFIWPEDREYPREKSCIEYFNMLLEDLQREGFDPDYDYEKDIQNKIQQMIDQQQQQAGKGKKKQKCKGKGKGKGKNSKKGKKQQTRGQGPGQEPGQGQGQDQEQEPSKYPGWFQHLLNKQHPHIHWLNDLEQMTDAELERALDRSHREAVKIIKNAVEQTERNNGTIPSNMKNAIDQLLEEPTVPWQQIVQGMMRSALASKIDESTTLPNPAFLHLDQFEPYPGYQKDMSFNIAIGIDTSGSVSDSEFTDFMSEIMGILSLREGVIARVIMFDAALQHEEVIHSYDKDKSVDRTAGSRYGYGGTSFEPFLRYVCGDPSADLWVPEAERAQNEPFSIPDLAIILTDGYAPVGPPDGPIPKYAPNCPLIWCLTSSGQEDEFMQPRIVKIMRG